MTPPINPEDSYEPDLPNDADSHLIREVKRLVWRKRQEDLERSLGSPGPEGDGGSESGALNDLDRGSLVTFWKSMMERRGDAGHTALLRVELLDVKFLQADAAGLVGSALQRATALMGAHLNHRDQVWRVHDRDRRRVPLMQVRQDRNVLWYAAAPDVGDQLALPGPAAADHAVRELLDYLPAQGDEDLRVERVVEGALGADQTIRRAIDAVAGIGTQTRSGLSLMLEGRASPREEADEHHWKRQLSVEVAARLHEDLLQAREYTTEETWFGTVDGMRMGKRVAYLIAEGNAANVSFENHHARAVRALIGHRVRAQVQVRHVESSAGVRERRYYRLLDLESLGEMLPGMDPSALPPEPRRQ